MLQALDEIPNGVVERRAQRVRGIGAHVAQQALDGIDDPPVDLVVHDARHPPGALRPYPLPDQLAVVEDGFGGEPRGHVQQLLLAVAREHHRESLAECRRHSRCAEPGAHHLAHERLHVFVGQRLERLGEPGRDLLRDAAAVFGIGEPAGGALGGVDRAQIRGDHVARQEVILDEVAEDAADPLLPRGDDRGVRDRQAEGVPEQRRDGEPVGEPPHERRLGRRSHPAEPGILRLKDAGGHEHDDRERQDTRRPPLHGVELGLPRGVVGPRPGGAHGGDPTPAGRRRRGSGVSRWRAGLLSHTGNVTPTVIRATR